MLGGVAKGRTGALTMGALPELFSDSVESGGAIAVLLLGPADGPDLGSPIENEWQPIADATSNAAKGDQPRDDHGRFAHLDTPSLAGHVKAAYERVYGETRDVKMKAKERTALDKEYRAALSALEARPKASATVATTAKSTPSAAPQTRPATTQDVATLTDKLKAVDQQHGTGNFVHLADLRAAHPEWSHEQFNAVIHKARQDGKVTLTPHEGREGVSERDLAAGIHEAGVVAGHGQRLVYASLVHNTADEGWVPLTQAFRELADASGGRWVGVDAAEWVRKERSDDNDDA